MSHERDAGQSEPPPLPKSAAWWSRLHLPLTGRRSPASSGSATQPWRDTGATGTTQLSTSVRLSTARSLCGATQVAALEFVWRWARTIRRAPWGESGARDPAPRPLPLKATAQRLDFRTAPSSGIRGDNPVVPGAALVLSGGGLLAVGWELGVMRGLQDGGVAVGLFDPIIGTSAGAIAGAHAAGGAPLEAIARNAAWDLQFSVIARQIKPEHMGPVFAVLRSGGEADPARRAQIGAIARQTKILEDRFLDAIMQYAPDGPGRGPWSSPPSTSTTVPLCPGASAPGFRSSAAWPPAAPSLACSRRSRLADVATWMAGCAHRRRRTWRRTATSWSS